MISGNVPFAKTGGFADMVGSLAKALATLDTMSRGHAGLPLLESGIDIDERAYSNRGVQGGRIEVGDSH